MVLFHGLLPNMVPKVSDLAGLRWAMKPPSGWSIHSSCWSSTQTRGMDTRPQVGCCQKTNGSCYTQRFMLNKAVYARICFVLALYMVNVNGLCQESGRRVLIFADWGVVSLGCFLPGHWPGDPATGWLDTMQRSISALKGCFLAPVWTKERMEAWDEKWANIVADCRAELPVVFIAGLFAGMVAYQNPIFVTLPPLCWLPAWKQAYKRPAVRLQKALY